MRFYRQKRIKRAIAAGVLLMVTVLLVLSLTATERIILEQKSSSQEIPSDKTFDRSLSISMTTCREAEDKTEPRLNTVDVIKRTLVKGTGSYRLSKPRGQLKPANTTATPPLSWSQYAQDQLIDRFLRQKRGGFFVEIGGYDGETNSNTLFLEKERGWNGLLIEANPYLYKKMVEKDRQCYMINCCISNDVPEMTFLMADALTAAENVLSSSHKERIDREQNESLADPNYGGFVTTQCFSLMDILDMIGQRHIDYFSLDVEGAELYILKSLDWKKLDINYFTIETDQHRDGILAFMDMHGYDWRHRILGDDIFKKRTQYFQTFLSYILDDALF